MLRSFFDKYRKYGDTDTFLKTLLLRVLAFENGVREME